MARRSRAVVETVKAKFRVWRIVIYIRLSKEDARCLDESESVTNQRQIIEDHIAGFNDGDEYIIVDEYVDDGISGTTDDERDDFQRMLADIKRGRVNCVIVKDLERSFRNYSDQGYYLDDWFPGTMSALSLCITSRWTATENPKICGASPFQSRVFSTKTTVRKPLTRYARCLI
ncbi:hypothetical protein BN3662_03054 [Clostridiales bacterium CHKCI006]|nr:hypothetical protein BN3662_03054 [Clostridiales bacterium CHKCI006]